MPRRRPRQLDLLLRVSRDGPQQLFAGYQRLSGEAPGVLPNQGAPRQIEVDQSCGISYRVSGERRNARFCRIAPRW